jgi:hypothetical protein
MTVKAVTMTKVVAVVAVVIVLDVVTAKKAPNNAAHN